MPTIKQKMWDYLARHWEMSQREVNARLVAIGHQTAASESILSLRCQIN